MAREFRRVVTGHDETGKAVVVSDETATQYLERPNRPGVRLTNFWIERGTPAEYDGATETCHGDFILRPPTMGSTFRCVEFLPEDPEVLAKGEVAIRLPGRWYRLTFPADSIPHEDPISSLDVALLQDRVLAPILGIGDPRTDSRIGFVGGIRGTRELEQRIDEGTAAVAFGLHATSMDELLRVADAGEIMPPKSTWFEPKLRSGLFAHRFETTEECVTR